MASQRPTTGRRGRPPYPDILTPAEWRVLDLLRQGLSNPGIAERLALSRDTVKTHVTAILAKLGVASREEAAAWEPEAEAAREPQLRRWGLGLVGWLRPVTLGKAALIGASLVVLAGMGVLAWGVLRTSGDDTTAEGSWLSQISFVGQDGDVWLMAPDGGGLTSMGLKAKVQGSVSGLSWSPDGERLAFIAGEGGLGFFGSLYLANAESGDVISVASVEFSDALTQCVSGGGIAWSPDGSRFAYSTNPPGIYIVDAGSATVDATATGYGPTWSSDGEATAYVAEDFAGMDESLPDNLCSIVVASADSPSDVRRIGTGLGPVWSPDGRHIAYRSGSNIVIADSEGGSKRQIDVGERLARFGPLNWSPDSTRLAISLGEVVVVDAVTGEQTEMTAGWDPQWSADGMWIAYTLAEDDPEPTPGRPQRDVVYIIPSDGSAEPVRLAVGSGPDWRSLPAGSVPSSAADLFELESYKRIDADADPKGGGPAYVVGREISIRTHSTFVKRIEIVAGIGSQDNAASASVFPDSDGYATATLTLPETGVVYVVQGYGISVDQSPLGLGEAVYGDERAVSTGAFRVIAEDP